MGRIVYAEENILNYLTALTKENNQAIGIIIGQSTRTKNYVVHLARTPEARDVSLGSQAPVETLTFKSVKEIEVSLVADHAKHVTAMLPGGFSVLGIFICSPNNIFNDSSLEPTLKKILQCVKKVLAGELFPDISNEAEKLIFHYNPVDKKYICKQLDVNNPVLGAFTQIDWKFQNCSMKWCQISSKFDMNWPSIGGKTSLELKTQLKNFLLEVNKLLDPALIVIGDKIQNQDSTLESLSKNPLEKKNNSHVIEHFKASIYTPLHEDPSYKDDILVTKCDVELNLMGLLRSQVFISQKATLEEAVAAVKQDIVRSLAARMELHWDSLIDEEYGSPEEEETIHEPPRRVSICLPNSEICFNDYIFPGEGAAEVISTFKELLDLDITEDNVNEEFEIHGDPLDLCGKSAISVTSTSSDDLLSSKLPASFLIAIISFAIILVAIAIALRNAEKSFS